MALELHETHPSLVHFPLSFFPLSLAADAVGELLDRDDLRDMARWTMPLAAGSAALASVSGLVAQQEVEASEHGTEMIITHRNLNLMAGALLGGMAFWRWGRDRPGAAYLAAGAAGLGAMFYSAWLGGEMVYSHGIGVHAAGGVREDVPEVEKASGPRAVRRAAEDAVDAGRMAVEETAEGDVAPSLGDEH